MRDRDNLYFLCFAFSWGYLCLNTPVSDCFMLWMFLFLLPHLPPCWLTFTQAEEEAVQCNAKYQVGNKTGVGKTAPPCPWGSRVIHSFL